MNPVIVYSVFEDTQPTTICHWQLGLERPEELPEDMHELADAFERICEDPLIRHLPTPSAGNHREAFRCNVGIIAAFRSLLGGSHFGNVKIHVDYHAMSDTGDGWKPENAGVQFPVTLHSEVPTSARRFLGIQP